MLYIQVNVLTLITCVLHPIRIMNHCSIIAEKSNSERAALEMSELCSSDKFDLLSLTCQFGQTLNEDLFFSELHIICHALN